MTEYTNNDSGDKAIGDAYEELNLRAPLHTPESLDAAILAEAHRAVQARPRRVRSSVFRWAPPLALAATVVITATLVILVPLSERQKGQESLEPQSREIIQSAEKERTNLKFKSTAAVTGQPQSMQQLSAPPMQADELAQIEPEIAVSDIILPESASSSATNADRQRTIGAIAKSQQLLSATTTLSGEAAKRQASLAEPMSADSPQADPKSWRELIEKLLKNEQWDRADEEFQAFKLVHPRHEFIKIYERKSKARDGG
jgi:TolA-binding protein